MSVYKARRQTAEAAAAQTVYPVTTAPLAHKPFGPHWVFTEHF